MQEKLGDFVFSYDAKCNTYDQSDEVIWCYDNVTIISSSVYKVGKTFEQMSILYKYNQTGMQVDISFETSNGELCNGY